MTRPWNLTVCTARTIKVFSFIFKSSFACAPRAGVTFDKRLKSNQKDLSYGARGRRNRSFYETRLSSPSRLQHHLCKRSLIQQKIRFQKRTLCCALQSAKQKRKASAHFQTRIFSARRKAFLILGFIKSSLNNLHNIKTNLSFVRGSPEAPVSRC